MSKEDLQAVEWALEHCLAYFKAYKPKYCGIEDDRDYSPYNDTKEALETLTKESRRA